MPILLTLCDGVILCYLGNLIYSDKELIDSRAIHYQDVFNPISDEHLFDNFQLLLSFAKSINISLDTYNAKYILKRNPSKLASLLIDFINGISFIYLSNKININKYHELIRLVKNNEDISVIHTMSGNQWLQRWINYINGDRVLSDINRTKFNMKLFNAINDDNDYDDYDDNEYSEEYIVKQLIEYIPSTTININDLLSQNEMLQYLFAANLFELKNGIWSKLSNDEKINYKQQNKGKDIDNLECIEWINILLFIHKSDIETITNIKDLCSGYTLLSILDLIKPGCIQRNTIRKFDKINNCNIVISICSKQFDFNLVGYVGSDIIDGNDKMIQSIILQLMQYYSTSKQADND